MNGPQHYLVAEEWATTAANRFTSGESYESVTAAAAVAQAHAELAKTAAIAQNVIENTELPDEDCHEWIEAIGYTDRRPSLRSVQS